MIDKSLEIIEDFEKLKNKHCPDLHVDYGYSLEYLSQKIFDRGLVKLRVMRLDHSDFLNYL